MSIPHDYYDKDHLPQLHNRGEGHPYVEPDWFAHSHDGALPIISTIGRGPKGDGITAKREGADLIIENDLGEQVAKFTIGDWDVSIKTPSIAEITGGKDTYFDIVVSDGTNEKTSRVTVPCGPQGSRIFIRNAETLDYNEDDVYEIDKADICSYNGAAGDSGVDPRVGDVVFMAVTGKDDNVDLTVASIVSTQKDSDNPSIAIVTAQLYIPVEINNITNNYDNYIGATDYEDLENIPGINGVQLIGDKTLDDLGIEQVDPYSERFRLTFADTLELVSYATPSPSEDSECIALGGGLYLVSFIGAAYGFKSLTQQDTDVDKFMNALASAQELLPILRLVEDDDAENPNNGALPICCWCETVFETETASEHGQHNPAPSIPFSRLVRCRDNGWSTRRFVDNDDHDLYVCVGQAGKPFYDAYYDVSDSYWKCGGLTAGIRINATVLVKVHEIL